MRKVIILGVASASLAFGASAAQRGAAMPAMPAPAPAMHAMPAPAVHAPAPSGHLPVAGSHLPSPHGPVSAHPTASTHTGTPPSRGTHVSAPGGKGSATPTRPGSAATPVIPISPRPISNIPGFLPGDVFTGQSCYFGDCYPVPGFGFDYTHFFAVHPNWGKFHPVTGVVVPGWGGGLYWPVPYYTESTPREGQEENASAPAEQPESNVRASAPTEEPAPAPSRAYSYAPAQPVEEYVFVKRDGTRIFAVAYSLSKDRLQYITKEGLRRSLPLDALDYDATMKSNEERGNTVSLPGAPPAAMAMLR